MKNFAQLTVTKATLCAEDTCGGLSSGGIAMATCLRSIVGSIIRWIDPAVSLGLPRMGAVLFTLWLALSMVNLAGADELDTYALAPSNSALAQELRAALIWQDAEAVQARLGAPASQRAPIGTHATYSLWVYEQVVVAFANGRVIHVFDKRELDRPSS